MFIDTVGYSKLSMNEQRVAIDHRFQKLVAKAIVPEGEIIDVFSAAGLKQPDISILSDQFLAEVRGRRESQKDECRRKKFRRFLFIILPSNFASHLVQSLRVFRRHGYAATSGPSKCSRRKFGLGSAVQPRS